MVIERFPPGSPLHLAILAGLAVATWLLCRGGRAVLARSADHERRLVVGFGVSVVLAQLLSQVWQNVPSRFDATRTLPLHACDLIPWVGVAALLAERRWARELTYFWGFGLSVWALLVPAIPSGPGQLRFWLFWVCHGQIVAIACYLVFVRRFRPSSSGLRLSVATLVAFAMLVTPINLQLGSDYGYFGRESYLQRIGPWPQRIAIMLVVESLFFALLFVAWRRRPAR